MTSTPSGVSSARACAASQAGVLTDERVLARSRAHRAAVAAGPPAGHARPASAPRPPATTRGRAAAGRGAGPEPVAAEQQALDQRRAGRVAPSGPADDAQRSVWPARPRPRAPPAAPQLGRRSGADADQVAPGGARRRPARAARSNRPGRACPGAVASTDSARAIAGGRGRQPEPIEVEPGGRHPSATTSASGEPDRRRRYARSTSWLSRRSMPHGQRTAGDRPKCSGPGAPMTAAGATASRRLVDR